MARAKLIRKEKKNRFIQSDAHCIHVHADKE